MLYRYSTVKGVLLLALAVVLAELGSVLLELGLALKEQPMIRTVFTTLPKKPIYSYLLIIYSHRSDTF